MTHDTDPDLPGLAEEVRGLRADLRDYRDTIANVLEQRLRAMLGLTIALMVAAVTIGGGAVWLLDTEAERAARVRADAAAVACQYVTVQHDQLLEVIAALAPEMSDAVVQDSLVALQPDPCVVPTDDQP